MVRLRKRLERHWVSYYFMRLLIEKALCLSGLSFLQEKIKKLVHRHDKIDHEFIMNRLIEKSRLFDRLSEERVIKTVCEQGTGWHGIDLIVFYLKGVDKIYTYDVRFLLKSELLQNTIQLIVKNRQTLEQHFLKSRLVAISFCVNQPLASVLAHLNVEYKITDHFATRPGDTDLFYSDSVLQRLLVNDLGDYVVGCVDSSKNALHYHRVDCKDFLSIRVEDIIPPLFYLRIPHFVWNLITCKRLNYQNRLRLLDFVKIFSESGLACELSTIRTFPGVEKYVVKHKLDKKLNQDARDVAVCSFDVFAAPTAAG